MKVLHLCKYDYGGAGNAAYRLHKGLELFNVDSRMMVIQRKKKDENIYVFSPRENIFSRQLRKWLNRRMASDFHSYSKSRPKGLEIFSDDRSLFNLESDSLIHDADIINLHWIAGMVNYSKFFPKIIGKPVVWTLHDMNPFTGGCHYSGGCKKYETECGECPQLGSNMFNDLANAIWHRKQKAYLKQNIYCVTPSKWLGDCAKNSRLLGMSEVKVIPNGLPTTSFIKKNRQESRDRLGLPIDKTILLFGAEDSTNVRKGTMNVIASLKLLGKKVDTSKIAAAVFGHKTNELVEKCDFPIYPIDFVKEDLMPACYSAADLFIIASLEDNLPNTVIESMACEVPVVGFNVGGIPDMIHHKETGLLAESNNVQDLCDKILWMINNPDKCSLMGIKARQVIEKEYSINIQAKEYYKLYKSILSEKDG